jgi:putative transposase
LHAETPLTAEPSCKDEARIGQKNKITRRWARRGTRPSAPRDQRTLSTYIFGAICPARGTGAGLVLPRCNTAAMALHLAEISQRVTPGAHAVLLLDQAGWHLSDKLDIPDNITLMPLPPKSPELNPVENIWGYAGASRLDDCRQRWRPVVCDSGDYGEALERCLSE